MAKDTIVEFPLERMILERDGDTVEIYYMKESNKVIMVGGNRLKRPKDLDHFISTLKWNGWEVKE
jgi:hypothetical protein